MERCFEIREIAALAGLPADDPRLRHLEKCPRCRSLAQAHAEFLDPGDTSDLAGLAAADAELQQRLGAALAAEPARIVPVRRRRVWLAAAAVLALCAVGLAASDLLRLRDGKVLQEGARLRGDDEVADLVVTEVDTGLQLVWPDAPEVETIIYVFLDGDLAEIGRRDSTGNLTLDAAAPEARAVFCQALAVAQGDTLARTAIVRLRPARE